MAKKSKDYAPTFGIGEWYGKSLIQLSGAERRQLAAEAVKAKKDRTQLCPFLQARKPGAICSKAGGVCSIRQYSYSAHPTNGRAMGIPVEGKTGAYRATCPYRFHDALEVFRWVGEVVLGDPDAKLIGEVGFLEAGPTTDSPGGEDVGRIDMVLVSSKGNEAAPLAWVALEIQAVYFSGNAMTGEFKAFADPAVDWVIFPAGRRHPDYRSSGPKRFMPQLQIKVPTLRRWGKKMAVVVDRAFFDSIGDMDNVADISNADIAWFIVRFEEVPGEKRARIVRDEVRYTTLERSVEGLTGGKAVPLGVFESRIDYKTENPEAIGQPSSEDGVESEDDA